jgi:hypothetical protein
MKVTIDAANGRTIIQDDSLAVGQRKWEFPASQAEAHLRAFNDTAPAETRITKGDADALRDVANEFTKTQKLAKG